MTHTHDHAAPEPDAKGPSRAPGEQAVAAPVGALVGARRLPPSAAAVASLQRAAGNAAIGRLVRRAAPRSAPPPSRPAPAPVVGGSGVATVARKDAGGDDATAVTMSGTPDQIVARMLKSVGGDDKTFDPKTWLTVVTVGDVKARIYLGGRFQGDVEIDQEQLAPSPPGVYMDAGGKAMQMFINAKGAVEWRTTFYSDDPTKQKLILPIAAKDVDRFLALRKQASSGWVVVRPAPVGGGGAGPSTAKDQGAGAGTAGAGAGEGATEGPVIPDWARDVHKYVTARVRQETKSVAAIAAQGVQERGLDAVTRLRHEAGVPDAVVLGMRETMPVLGVRVGKHSGTIGLRKGDQLNLTWDRVQALTRALVAGVKTSGDASLGDMAAGLAGGKPDPDKVPANAPSLTAQVRNLGPAVGITGATHRFSMWIDWGEAGDHGVFEAFGPRSFYWEVVRIRTESGALAKEGDARRSRRREATVSDLDRRKAEIKEDYQATIDEEGWSEVPLAELDAEVRKAGAYVRAFISLATQPYDEQGIQFDAPGTYIIRCTSARPGIDKDDAGPDVFVRAPSIAFVPLKVTSPAAMATSLVSTSGTGAKEEQLADLKAQAAASPDAAARLAPEIAELEADIARRKAADKANVPSFLGTSTKSIDEQIDLVKRLRALLASGTDHTTWSDFDARSLRVDLELRGEDPARTLANLEKAKAQLAKQQGAVGEVAEDFHAGRSTFRPHMAFVPHADGRSLPLLMMLGEHADSKEQRKHWELVDLSTPGHHDRYHGYSSAADAPGHVAAIKAAIEDFRGEVPYGRGTLAIRFPEELATSIGAKVDLPPTLYARPDADARSRQRLESLAEAAAVAGLILTGPVGATLGIIGGVAGATVAAYRIYRRYDGGYLEADLATALDITAIVGAVVAPAGAWAGSVRAGSRWVEVADLVETGVRRFGYLQMGQQVFVIPYTLAKELASIPANLSPGERRARQAEAFLKATRAGLELAVGAYRVVEEVAAGPRVRPGPDDGGAPRPAGGEEPAAPGPGPRDAGDGGADAGGSLPTPKPAVTLEPVPPPSARATGAPATERYGVGASADRPRRPLGSNERRPPTDFDEEAPTRPGRDGDEEQTTPDGRRPRDEEDARAPQENVERYELQTGDVLMPPEHLRTNEAFARSLFESTYGDGRLEVVRLVNATTKEQIIVVGEPRKASLEMAHANWQEILPPELRRRGLWVDVEHAHPVVEGTGVTARSDHYPSGGHADFHAAADYAYMRRQPFEQAILWRGRNGLQRTRYGIDPFHQRPLWIQLPYEAKPRRFATIEDYHDFYHGLFPDVPQKPIPDDFTGPRRGRPAPSLDDPGLANERAGRPTVDPGETLPGWDPNGPGRPATTRDVDEAGATGRHRRDVDEATDPDARPFGEEPTRPGWRPAGETDPDMRPLGAEEGAEPTTGTGTTGPVSGAPVETRPSRPLEAPASVPELRYRYITVLGDEDEEGRARSAYLRDLEGRMRAARRRQDVPAQQAAVRELAAFERVLVWVERAQAGIGLPAGFETVTTDLATFRSRYGGRVRGNVVYEFPQGRAWRDPATREIVVQDTRSAGARPTRGRAATSDLAMQVVQAAMAPRGAAATTTLGRYAGELVRTLEAAQLETALRTRWAAGSGPYRMSGEEVPTLWVTARIRPDRSHRDLLGGMVYTVEGVGRAGAGVLAEISLAVSYDDLTVTLTSEPLAPGPYALLREVFAPAELLPALAERVRTALAAPAPGAADDVGATWQVGAVLPDVASTGAAPAEEPGDDGQVATTASGLVDQLRAARGDDVAAPFRARLTDVERRVVIGDPIAATQLRALAAELRRAVAVGPTPGGVPVGGATPGSRRGPQP